MTGKHWPYVIAGCALVLLEIAAIAFIHLPLAEGRRTKQLIYAEKSAQLKLVREKVQELTELRAEIQEMQAETAVLEAKIPGRADIPGIVRLLESFSAESGVVVTDVNFADNAQQVSGAGGENAPAVITNTCRLNIRGKYGSVIRFFEALKNSPRLFGIKAVNFSPTGPDGRELNINLTLAYFNYNAPASNQAPAQNL